MMRTKQSMLGGHLDICMYVLHVRVCHPYPQNEYSYNYWYPIAVCGHFAHGHFCYICPLRTLRTHTDGCYGKTAEKLAGRQHSSTELACGANWRQVSRCAICAICSQLHFFKCPKHEGASGATHGIPHPSGYICPWQPRYSRLANTCRLTM